MFTDGWRTYCVECRMCLCDGTSRNENPKAGEVMAQKAINQQPNHWPWAQRTVYANKKRLCRAREQANARARRSASKAWGRNRNKVMITTCNNSTGGHIRRLQKILPRGRRLTVIVKLNYVRYSFDHVISPAKAHRKNPSVPFRCRSLKNLWHMLLTGKIHLPSLLCSLMLP